MTRPRVYVVDDYADNRVLFTALLEGAEIDVTALESGAALDRALAADARPDLLLIDIAMPGENGVSIVRRLRRDERFSSLRIVALTAHAMAGDVAAGRANGFDAYLTKPVDAWTFAETVRSLLPAMPERPTES